MYCMGQGIKSLAVWVFLCMRTGLEDKYLKTVENRGLVPMGHQQEMAYNKSIGHVTDGVTWHWKVKVMTPVCLDPKMAGDRDPITIEHPYTWKWHLRYGTITSPMTSCDPGRSSSWPRYIWTEMSRKRLKIEARFMGRNSILWIQWSRDRCDLVKSRSRPEYI